MSYSYSLIFLLFIASIYSALHALLYKTDSRAAFGWIIISLIVPLLGPILYFLFGVNRVHRRAKKLGYTSLKINTNDNHIQSKIPTSLRNIQHISYQITNMPLVGGNEIEILFSGNQTYPAMLNAINLAKDSICLSTYIFKVDTVGEKFIDALIQAKQRGVDVYVLIDGIGEHYSKIKARKILISKGVKVEQFLPLKIFPFNLYVNLRIHRKLLLIDDETSFVGGMNISDEYANINEESLGDMHFKLKGNIARQLKMVFKSDWNFTKGDDAQYKIENHEVIDKPKVVPYYN